MSKSTTPLVQIKSGMIVRFDGGWYRVTKATKNTVNLGAVFGGRVYHKGVDITLVQEDEAAWYANWSQSESYMCM
jgi:hypothetical protein